MAEPFVPWTIAAAREQARREGVAAVVAAFEERIDAAATPEAWLMRVDGDLLRARAAELDRLLDAGADLPLAGVPFAVKDNIDVAGVPTTAGCPEFAYVPDVSAPVVQRLLDAGALFVGKTNLDQLATGLVGTRVTVSGVVTNPHDPSFIAGGSSSGSAVVVATGVVPFALATDTAGSGRVPAALCGCVGLKPTVGRWSTRGVVPAMATFDCVSVMTGSVTDAATLLAVVEGDGSSRATTRWPSARRGAGSGRARTMPRVAVPAELEWFGDDDTATRFQHALDHAGDLGWEVRAIDWAPFRAAGALVYGSALVAERFAAFGTFVEANPEAVHPATRAILLGAREHSGVDAFRALERVEALRAEVAPLWDEVDALVVPTVARVPTTAEAVTDLFAPSVELGTYASFVNILDLCGVAVPTGTRASGLPFGITLVGPAFADELLLALAAAFVGEPTPSPPASVTRRLAVVGAHISGQPLHHQLTERGARLLASTTTAPEYRLFALETTPPKPGLLRDPDGGGAIEVEVWGLDDAGFGSFVAEIPAPLGIGKVALADGTEVSGFLCEPHALRDAAEITAFGGWRAYLAARAEA